MLTRFEKRMKVYAPSDAGRGALVGYYPISMSYKSAEQLDGGGQMYSNLLLSAFVKRYKAPFCGFRRGMRIVGDEGAEYMVLVPVLAGDTWILRLRRVLFDPETEVGSVG